MQLVTKQTDAIKLCCDPNERIVGITGPAGTGKTTILKHVHDQFVNNGFTVALCAPTGKAAKRITQATGIPAVTQHKLLEYPMPGEIDEKTGQPAVHFDPKRDNRNPFDEFVILCDEYTMTNTELHRNLIQALPAGGLIRMFGDVNQLPPIETNNRLKSLPSPFEQVLRKFPSVTLDVIHRQDEAGSIIVNSIKITKGIPPKRADDFLLDFTERPVRTIEDLFMESIDQENDYTLLTNQIISATNQGWIGTYALNATLQGLIRSAMDWSVEVERHNWAASDFLRLYVGDKVIYTKNCYPLGVFNGETGHITGIKDDGSVTITFEDHEVDVPPLLELEGRHGTFCINPQKDIDLAYVITTHKSQGSEYNNVIYAINCSRSYNLNRKNFYTAITRARDKVTLITDQRALSYSLNRKDVLVVKK